MIVVIVLGAKKPTEVGWFQGFITNAKYRMKGRAMVAAKIAACARSRANDFILCDLLDFGTDLHFAALV